MSERGSAGRISRRAPGRGRLLRADWAFVEKTSLDDFTAADWACMNRQRVHYNGEEIARQAVRLLQVSEHDATFGYQVNNYHHSLQTATLMALDGCDEESVVLGLLHDVGFTLCPDRHAELAAELLGPFLSERNEWILRMHPVFQQHHIHDYPGLDPRARERYAGHPHFAAAARFVERYDIIAIDPGLEEYPLEHFEPMVQRFFQCPKRTPGPPP